MARKVGKLARGGFSGGKLKVISDLGSSQRILSKAAGAPKGLSKTASKMKAMK